MKTKKIILSAFVAIFVFSNCMGEELGRCDLPKGLIPYKKEQTYSFIDELGQTINIPVTESMWDWIRSREDNSENYYTYRSQIVRLNTESNNLIINFRFDADGCMTGGDYNEIVIAITYLDKTCVFILPSNTEGILTDTYTSFHESIEINGKVYSDVFEQNFVTNAEVSTQLFYNTTYGILQVNRDGKNFLSINQKAEEIKSSSNADILNEEFGITSINDVKINTSETKLLRIYAVTGALVYSSSTDFNLKSAYLNKGIYIVETTNNLGEVKQEKIVVK